MGKLKGGKPKEAVIQKKLDAPAGKKVGPNIVKDVYDSATPDKVLKDPLGKKRSAAYGRVREPSKKYKKKE